MDFFFYVRDAGDVEETPRGDAHPSCHYFEGSFFFIYIYTFRHSPSFILFFLLFSFVCNDGRCVSIGREGTTPSTLPTPLLVVSTFHTLLLSVLPLEMSIQFRWPNFGALDAPPPSNFKQKRLRALEFAPIKRHQPFIGLFFLWSQVNGYFVLVKPLIRSAIIHGLGFIGRGSIGCYVALHSVIGLWLNLQWEKLPLN